MNHGLSKILTTKKRTEMNEMVKKVEELRSRKEKIKLAGGEEQIIKQHERGKLTARERIYLLLDPGSFMEIDMFAQPRKTGFDIDERDLPADAVITGSGEIDGRPVYVYAQDFTVLGGTLASVHGRKIVKIMEKALKMEVPCIGLIDSGGVRVQDFISIDLRNSYAPLFYLHTVSSGLIPQVSLLMGPCAAGASYSPILTDFVLMVKNTSYMYIASPTLIKAVTFVDVTEEQIGGPKMHEEVSGCCDLVTENDEDCLRKTRDLISFLPSNNREDAPIKETEDDVNRGEEELLQIVPANPKESFDMHKVINYIVDDKYFFEIKPGFAKNIITGFARLGGMPVGIIANNSMVLGGAIDINASDKEARFIRFCDAFNIPLIFFVDNPGYLPGVQQEQGGIIRHGAKVLYAISEATVPKITVFIRKAYGGGGPAMGTESQGTDLLLAWPTAEIGLMGSEGAVEIIYRKEISSSQNPEEVRQRRLKEYNEKFCDFPYRQASLLWIEDIIDPRDTRPILINALRRMKRKKVEGPWRRKKHGNIPL